MYIVTPLLTAPRVISVSVLLANVRFRHSHFSLLFCDILLHIFGTNVSFCHQTLSLLTPLVVIRRSHPARDSFSKCLEVNVTKRKMTPSEIMKKFTSKNCLNPFSSEAPTTMPACTVRGPFMVITSLPPKYRSKQIQIQIQIPIQ